MSAVHGLDLRLEGVTKVYPGVVALNDVSLQIKAGEVVGLLGENGLEIDPDEDSRGADCPDFREDHT